MLRMVMHSGHPANSFFRFFAALLLAAILLSWFLYSNIESITLNALSNLNHELSVQANNFTSQLHQLVQSYGMQAFYTPSIILLRESGTLSNFEIIQGLRELKSFVNSSNFVHSVYAYNATLDFVFSTADSGPDIGSAPTGQFHDAGALPLLMGKEPGSRMMPIYRTIPRAGGSVEEVYSFVLYEYDPANEQPVTSSLLVNIPSAWMQRFVAELLLDTDTFIINEAGDLVLQPVKANAGLILEQNGFVDAVRESDREDGYIISGGSRNRYVCFYTRMQERDWIFLRILPYEECLQGLAALRAKNFAIIALIAGAGLLFLTVMLLQLYFPFFRLIRSFSRIPMTEPDFLHKKSISGMVQEVTAHVEDYAGMLRSEFLRRLLMDPAATHENIGENFRQYQISLDLQRPVFLLLACGDELECYAQLLADNGLTDNLEGLTIGKYSVFLLQPGPGQDFPRETCLLLAEQWGILCAYSLPIDDFRLLRRSYQRMTEVLDLRIFYPGAKLLSEALLNELSKENVYPDKMEAKLLQALRSGKGDQARKQLREIVEFARGYRYNVVTFIFKRLYLAISNLLRSVTGAESPHSLKSSIEAIDNLLIRMENVDELIGDFNRMFEVIVERSLYSKQLKTLRLVEQVKERIQAGYCDPGLSVQTIADEMEMSPDYLGKLFRSLESMSVSQHINRIRIDQAKRLLLGSDLTIREIARRVGFENVQYFFTLFKSSSQMTPTEYRKQPE